MIKILFFAHLREQLQCSEISVKVSDAQTVAQLRDYLIQLHPQWAGFLNNDKVLVAVNQTVAKMSQSLLSGDEVAFFPPVTGG